MPVDVAFGPQQANFGPAALNPINPTSFGSTLSFASFAQSTFATKPSDASFGSAGTGPRPLGTAASQSGPLDRAEKKDDKREKKPIDEELDLSKLYVPPLSLTRSLDRLNAQLQFQDLPLERLRDEFGALVRTVTQGQPTRANVVDTFA
ncbi:MAG: hypothetical protein JNK11_18550 [Alphaproteobacteria bacterium]|nr:hypothetical protein [Alphaproteobacteria bacterium]